MFLNFTNELLSAKVLLFVAGLALVASEPAHSQFIPGLSAPGHLLLQGSQRGKSDARRVTDNAPTEVTVTVTTPSHPQRCMNLYNNYLKAHDPLMAHYKNCVKTDGATKFSAFDRTFLMNRIEARYPLVRQGCEGTKIQQMDDLADAVDGLYASVKNLDAAAAELCVETGATGLQVSPE